MKISYSIFLVGIILVMLEGMIVYADLGSSSKNLVAGLVSENVFDKISTLYFFIIVILFFFGGIIFLFERGMKVYSLTQYRQEMNSKNPK